MGEGLSWRGAEGRKYTRMTDTWGPVKTKCRQRKWEANEKPGKTSKREWRRERPRRTSLQGRQRHRRGPTCGRSPGIAAGKTLTETRTTGAGSSKVGSSRSRRGVPVQPRSEACAPEDGRHVSQRAGSSAGHTAWPDVPRWMLGEHTWPAHPGLGGVARPGKGGGTGPRHNMGRPRTHDARDGRRTHKATRRVTPFT